MKRITVSVDEETYRLAEDWAKIRGISVNELVCEYLNNLPKRSHAPPKKTLGEIAEDFRAKGIWISVSENVSREELYDRDALR